MRKREIYLAPRTDFPHDVVVLAVVVDGAGLDLQGFLGRVAPVGHGIRVGPTVVVDPVAGHCSVFHTFAATVRALK